MDYQDTGLTEQQLEEWFLKKANVSVYMGSVFGEAGRGCIRLNVASRSVLYKHIIACGRPGRTGKKLFSEI
ncbi:MAG: hypothetical protein ACLTSZ_08140 [Lachnospiraceae bacterium]